jgi:hypothetical protein
MKESKKSKSRKKLDHVYQIGKASEFSQITKYLINHIRKWYTDGDDIANALEERKDPDFSQWLPTLHPDYDETDPSKTATNRGYMLLFEAEIKEHVERKERYRSNEGNAYAFLFGQCNKALQNKIQSRNDFTMIKNKSIALLQAIGEHSLCYQENKYPMSIIADAIRNLINLKQKEKESLVDYIARFRSARDIMISQIGGPIVFPKYMKTAGIPCEAKAFENFLAWIFLENADRNKYGTIVNGLATQYSLNNDQYPKTLLEVHNVLSNHRMEKKPEAVKKNATGSDEKNEEEPKLSFAQLEDGKCFCCGKAGHKSPQCRHKSRPKDAWVINKVRENKKSVNEEKKKESKDDEEKKPNWMCLQYLLAQRTEKQIMKNALLLDSQSTIDLMCNPQQVSNIRPAREPLLLTTNAGTLEVNLEADLPGYGTVYFNPDAITNVISLANMETKYKVTYDSSKENATWGS